MILNYSASFVCLQVGYDMTKAAAKRLYHKTGAYDPTLRESFKITVTKR